MKLDYCVATFEQPAWRECVHTWHDNAAEPHEQLTAFRMDVVDAYQMLYEKSDADILFYGHDDLKILEPGWDKRILAEFEQSNVGLVGFAGAPGHGHPMMYKQPFHVSSMGRVGFKSNMRDAEMHGARFTGSCEVSVLDGMAMAVRREVLEKAGGWPIGTEIGYFAYDFWACCVTRRLDYRIRLVGVSCEHLGGRSTGLNPNLKVNHEEAHRYIYDKFRDVLPAMVTE